MERHRREVQFESFQRRFVFGISSSDTVAYYCVYVVYVYTCLLPRYTVSFFVVYQCYCYCYTVAFWQIGFGTCQSVMCVCISWHADAVGRAFYVVDSAIFGSYFHLFSKRIFIGCVCFWSCFGFGSVILCGFIYFIRGRERSEELILTIHSYTGDQD